MISLKTDGADPIHKATIMPRGRALGMVMQLPDGDQTSMSRKQMLAKLDICMGGEPGIAIYSEMERDRVKENREREKKRAATHCVITLSNIHILQLSIWLMAALPLVCTQQAVLRKKSFLERTT